MKQPDVADDVVAATTKRKASSGGGSRKTLSDEDRERIQRDLWETDSQDEELPCCPLCRFLLSGIAVLIFIYGICLMATAIKQFLLCADMSNSEMCIEYCIKDDNPISCMFSCVNIMKDKSSCEPNFQEAAMALFAFGGLVAAVDVSVTVYVLWYYNLLCFSRRRSQQSLRPVEQVRQAGTTSFSLP